MDASDVRSAIHRVPIRFDFIRALTELFGRFNNPILAAVLTFAVLLQLTGYAVEFFTAPRMLSGFLMVFAMLFATFSLFGYLLVFSFKAFLKLDRKYGLTTS